MELTLTLEPESQKSLQSQIFDQIRSLILDGRLQAGMALPPSRVLAETFNVARNTVIVAYERLAAEGYVEPRGTAGIFVSNIPPDDLLLISGVTDQAKSKRAPDAQSAEPLLCFAGLSGGEDSRPELDFWVGRSAASSFPLDVWRRIVTKALSGKPHFLTDYCDPAGLPELRQAVADHLGRGRGMQVAMDQVIMTAGSQEALNLVIGLLRARTQQFCIENPGYIGASMLFQNEGIPINHIPVDKDGIRTELLPNTRRTLVFVTPSHQFPTGVTMSLGHRLALLRWAEDTDSYIIEDDYDSDLRYEGPPLTSLAGLDGGRRVFYIGTFSKSVGAGLRLGFAVVPHAHSKNARALKAQMSNGQPWLEQRALSEFIAGGHFDRHLRKLRSVYKSRRDTLMAALKRHFDDPIISGQDGGLHLVWHLPSHFPNAKTIQENARRIGIGVYSFSSGGAFDFADDAPDNRLMFGYSSLSETEIDQAITNLRDLLASTKPCTVPPTLEEPANVLKTIRSEHGLNSSFYQQ
ncbi:MocR-like pyridoxine biosynthesis transcription factor PdxR [Rhizobium rhizogenes]|uniref:MocR-like pyridoxine biosynthesis transcription factor PdxR n=1 Tax=Rhizobium rhizogenes TaxID=359 RepID=UPI0015732008|nr:PLP-dependent aminotransferase family protein [Rhizobium rhizogenes]NTH22953.1 PLP-dependent aminotransferase family protein [Rhizobium rhizogenes]NTH35983.1 PLP-dependent aminotransferase family protein [Rhizobium rhizogenes]